MTCLVLIYSASANSYIGLLSIHGIGNIFFTNVRRSQLKKAVNYMQQSLSSLPIIRNYIHVPVHVVDLGIMLMRKYQITSDLIFDQFCFLKFPTCHWIQECKYSKEPTFGGCKNRSQILYNTPPTTTTTTTMTAKGNNSSENQTI